MFNISLLIKSFVSIKLIIYTYPKFSIDSSIKFRDFKKKNVNTICETKDDK